MAPFEEPKSIIKGFKERIESLLIQGNKLYLGTATGNIHVYTINESEANSPATFQVSHKAVSRRSIEQLAYIKDVNSFVLLADSLVSLYTAPGFEAPRQLLQTKGALCFAINNGVIYVQQDGTEDKDGENSKGTPTMLTHLAVGCKRKVVIYSWKDGDAQEVKELILPHSPRAIAFFSHKSLLMAYTVTEHVHLSIPHMAVSTVDTSVPSGSLSSLSVGGLSVGEIKKLGVGMGMGNLGGYIGLGSGPKKPQLVKCDADVIVPRDEHTLIVDSAGKLTTSRLFDTVAWPAVPEEVTYLRPYLISAFPPNTIPLSPLASLPTDSASIASALNISPTPTLQIRSSLHPTSHVQTIPYPFEFSTVPSSPTPNQQTPTYVLRALSTQTSSMLFVTHPSDKAALQAEGFTVWNAALKPLSIRIDDLIDDGLYEEALRMLDQINEALLPDKAAKVHLAQTLLALFRFKSGYFQEALGRFQDLDTNPALVLSLYPEVISGRLTRPEEDWIELFGGKAKIQEKKRTGSAGSEEISSQVATPTTGEMKDKEKTSFGGAWRATLDTLIPSTSMARKDNKEQTVVSQSDKDKLEIKKANEEKAREQIKDMPDARVKKMVEALLQYLPDRRQKVLALRKAPMHPLQNSKQQLAETAAEDALPSLSTLPVTSLLSLPSVPPSQLTSAQLTTYAQIIDTALFKAYLLIRPSLIGSLCRIGNWCEVNEVEALLRARDKLQDLVHLFNGKRMHREALELLRELAANVEDLEEKLRPSVSYLQKLGPEHIDQVFEFSRWILSESPDIGFQIFTSDDVILPRNPVTDYLESIDPDLAIRYIRFQIDERGDLDAAYHERMATLLISRVSNLDKHGNQEASGRKYDELLAFLNDTSAYRADRLLGSLPSEGMFEARAILLGRLGRHESSLEIYVNKLKDYKKAEEYCTRVYSSSGSASSIFLTLLRIYLRPQPQATSLTSTLFGKPTTLTTPILLEPALDLIARHSRRLGALNTLDLLPPLVTAQDVKQFLVEVLRIPKFDTAVLREIWRARDLDLGGQLIELQNQRVEITDTRICPYCHKRLGNVAVAVHFPRGEVTHYQCREPFSQQLAAMSETKVVVPEVAKRPLQLV